MEKIIEEVFNDMKKKFEPIAKTSNITCDLNDKSNYQFRLYNNGQRDIEFVSFRIFVDENTSGFVIYDIENDDISLWEKTDLINRHFIDFKPFTNVKEVNKTKDYVKRVEALKIDDTIEPFDDEDFKSNFDEGEETLTLVQVEYTLQDSKGNKLPIIVKSDKYIDRFEDHLVFAAEDEPFEDEDD